MTIIKNNSLIPSNSDLLKIVTIEVDNKMSCEWIIIDMASNTIEDTSWKIPTKEDLIELEKFTSKTV